MNNVKESHSTEADLLEQPQRCFGYQVILSNYFVNRITT